MLNKPDFLQMWGDTDGINHYNEVTCNKYINIIHNIQIMIHLAKKY